MWGLGVSAFFWMFVFPSWSSTIKRNAVKTIQAVSCLYVFNIIFFEWIITKRIMYNQVVMKHNKHLFWTLSVVSSWPHHNKQWVPLRFLPTAVQTVQEQSWGVSGHRGWMWGSHATHTTDSNPEPAACSSVFWIFALPDLSGASQKKANFSKATTPGLQPAKHHFLFPRRSFLLEGGMLFYHCREWVHFLLPISP